MLNIKQQKEILKKQVDKKRFENSPDLKKLSDFNFKQMMSNNK